MYVANNGNNMNKKPLITSIIISIDANCTRNTTFATTRNYEFAFLHLGKVNTCFVTPKLMKLKCTLIAQYIIIKVIVNMITICRCLTFDNNKIFNVSTNRIVLLKIEDCSLNFFAGIFDLLSNLVCFSLIIFRRTWVILKQVIERELTLLIVNLNFEDMFKILLIKFKIFRINIIYCFVNRHDFLILIFKFFQFFLFDLETAIRYRKKNKHNGE